MLIANVQIAGHRRLVDVRCIDGCIVEVGSSLCRRGEPSVDGNGAALIPGLHDHHIHLFALAAQLHSVQCGPPAVSKPTELASALCAESRSGWLRGVGYHESVAGALDRWQLDRIVSDRPVKVQHRNGKMWMVNSMAADLLSLDDNTGRPGVELDSKGRPNGRLFRLDDWMRTQLATGDPLTIPSLADTSRLLASYGVTGVTDATPHNAVFAMEEFARAAACGELLQRVRVMGGEGLPESGCDQVQRGERKVMLDEHALPDWDSLWSVFDTAHRQGRGVAVHCVTNAELVLALSVLRAVGSQPGDRIEHASLVPVDTLPLLQEVGVRVITQPGFIHERGDQYLLDIAATEHGNLYRCRELLAQGIPLGGSTDAPFGSADPWAAMRAAVQRKSRSGKTLGREERLSPEQALDLFTCAAQDPGGVSRKIAVGEAADLCLLNRPWEQARLRLCSTDVRATFRSGTLVYHQEQPISPGRHHAIVAA
jgi:predicted amidohydrolase YtcJ